MSYSYAITVWYFDAKERAEAKEKYRLGKLLYTRLQCPIHSLSWLVYVLYQTWLYLVQVNTVCD